MSNNIEAIQKVSENIESAIKECGVQAIANLPTFMQAIRIAQGIQALRSALSDDFMRQAIMPLQNTKLGFLTDNQGGYAINVVRDVSIEAMMRGFRVVGNEFNIIAGGFYGAKAGFSRKVAEFPGLTDLVLEPGVPHMIQDKGALVSFSASWKLNGKAQRIDCQLRKDGENVIDTRIPVRVNNGMGPDGILGKAERKLLARIYARLVGSTFAVPDGDATEEPIVTTGEPAPPPVPEGTPEGKRTRLGLNGKSKAQSQPPPAQDQASADPENDGR